MPNFTVAIPDDLLSEAKVVAARTGTSVNSMIRVLLDGHIQNLHTAAPGNYELLFKYSLGLLTSRAAIRELHLDSEDVLHEMVVRAGFPLPRLSLLETEQMQKQVGDLMDKSNRNAA